MSYRLKVNTSWDDTFLKVYTIICLGRFAYGQFFEQSAQLLEPGKTYVRL